MNDEIFKKIYMLYKNDVIRLAYSFTQNIVDAEEITQKVFIKLYKNITSIDNKANIKSWLLTVTSNECKNLLNSCWYKKIILLTSEDKSEFFNDELLELSECLKKIPKKYRIPIHLYYYYGYQIKEISKIMKINPQTIKTRLARGKKLLKIEMENYENEKN